MSATRGRAVGRRRGSSARRADRRSRRGSAGARGGRSGGSGGTDRPGPRSPRRPRRAGRRLPRGSPRWRPSNGRRSPPTVTSGRSRSARKAASASAPNSPALSGSVLGRVGAVAADVEGQACGTRRRGGRAASGSVRSRADSQPWTRTTPGPGAPSRAGMNQAGSGTPSDSITHRLERQAEVGRREPGRVAARIAGADPIGEREAIGETERRGDGGRGDPGATDVPHVP